MSIIDAMVGQALGELAKHPEIIAAAQEALRAGVTGESLVAAIKKTMTAASDEAMRVELDLI